MPTLLQINVEVNINSSGRIVEQIGEVALYNGWRSYIAYSRGYRASSSKTFKIGNFFDVIFHVFITRMFDMHGFGSYFATKRLIKKIKIIKPDIIQLHQIHGYYLNINLLFNFFEKTKIPIFWSFHDCWAFTGHCVHFVMINCNKWKLKCYNCPIKYSYPKSILFDRSQKNYSLKKNIFRIENLTIIPTSKWIENLVRESFLSQNRIELITNGIDLEKFQFRYNEKLKKKLAPRNEFILLGVGTEWSSNKGLYDYFKLRKILSEEYIIILVGLNINQINSLPKGIVGIKKTNSIEELTEYYSIADVVTSLSYMETFGLTPVEGFACGTPAIVYNNTALPELITKDVGYVVETGNLIDVANAIYKIKKLGKKYFSSACLQRSFQFYNKVNNYEKYIELYKRTLYK